MSPEVPGVWEAALLALAAYRIWRLLAEDTILDRPRRWVLRLGDDWQEEGDQVPDDYRGEWALFITCVYCAGFWISVSWWLAWLAFGDWTLLAATPWAISSLVVFQRRQLDPEED